MLMNGMTEIICFVNTIPSNPVTITVIKFNPWAVYDDDLDNSSMEEGGGGYLTEDDLELYKDEDDHQLDNYGAEDTNGQCSTAVSKLQIRLNDLINHRKAPLVKF